MLVACSNRTLCTNLYLATCHYRSEEGWHLFYSLFYFTTLDRLGNATFMICSVLQMIVRGYESVNIQSFMLHGTVADPLLLLNVCLHRRQVMIHMGPHMQRAGSGARMCQNLANMIQRGFVLNAHALALPQASRAVALASSAGCAAARAVRSSPSGDWLGPSCVSSRRAPDAAMRGSSTCQK